MLATAVPMLMTLIAEAAGQPAGGAIGASTWGFIGSMGGPLALGIAAIGSAIGISIAGQAASGAWGKEDKAGKTLKFTYIILLGMPLSQMFYALIVMIFLGGVAVNPAASPAHMGTLLGIGLAVGLAEMFSAWFQGMIGAAGIRAMSEGEGKSFAFVIIAMGIVETVGIFGMVFLLMLVPKIG